MSSLSSPKKMLNFFNSSSSNSSVPKSIQLNADIRQIADWSIKTTLKWLKTIGYEACSANFQEHRINGRALLMLNEDDLKEIIKFNVGMRKNLFHLICTLQMKHGKYLNKSESKKFFHDSTEEEDDDDDDNDDEDIHLSDNYSTEEAHSRRSGEDAAFGGQSSELNEAIDDPETIYETIKRTKKSSRATRNNKIAKDNKNNNENETNVSNGADLVMNEIADSVTVTATPTKNFCLNCLKKIDNSPYNYFETTSRGFVPIKSYKGEKRKTLVAVMYLFFTCLWTAFMLTVVHDRVPDMQKYPPLPDIILDNVPLIPWAFFATEVIGLVLLFITFAILLLHKYRMIIFRRMCGLGGTIFILRSITMLITSLSVPGVHIQCSSQRYGSFFNKLSGAWNILSGVGLYVHGVRTCGDYMFSGHTVWLTLLSHFITEYTPGSGRMKLVHTGVWILNIFGLFFILGAHEHYSIDVFVAFYISSRMFLYYHSLSSNRVLFQTDHKRVKIWFPMFSYFESNIHSRVPNEYQNPFKMIASGYKHLKSRLNKLKKSIWPTNNHHHHNHHKKNDSHINHNSSSPKSSTSKKSN